MGSSAAGITKRLGYFDDGDGLFLEYNGTTLNVVKRSFTSGVAVDTAVAQASWNIDRFDGTGVSGITLDLTKSQILAIDLEWLGVGSVRFGFIVNGQIFYAHQMSHANILTTAYMRTPNLPIRMEIINSGAGPAASLTNICCSIQSEGGRNFFGVDRAVDRGVTGFVTNNDALYYPVASIRLQTGKYGAFVQPSYTSLLCVSSAAYHWKLLLNPTVTGTPLSFSAVTNSYVETDVVATNATSVSAGTTILSGYAQQNTEGSVAIVSIPDLALGVDLAGVADVLVLAVARLSGTAETFYGSLGWHEEN